MGQEQDVKLVIEDEEGGRFVIPIEIGEVSLGRDEINTIRLDERNVSRRHARIFRDGTGVVFVEDLGSYNGVVVGGRRIDRAQAVEDGAQLQIGGFRLELRGIASLPVREETTQRNIAILAPIPAPRELNELEMTRTVQSPAPRPSPPEITSPNASIKAPVAAATPTANASVATSGTVEGFRLLGLTGAFLGKVWPVLGGEVVIGRGADSGIVIDHRSVSRHHARLTGAGDRLRIADLGSSNGILISGEVYKEAELRPGDIIELGHILLRVCAPGDEAVLTAHERTLGRARARGMRPTLGRTLGVLTVLAALGAAAYFVAESRQTRLPAAPPPVLVETPVAALMRGAHEAASARQWPRASTLVQAALAMAPEDADARTLSEQVAHEVQLTAVMQDAETAAAEHRWADAYNALMQAPKVANNTPAWQALMARIQPALEAERIADARRALESGDVEEAQTLVEEVRALEPNHRELTAVTQAIEGARRLAEAKVKSRAQAPVSSKVAHSSRPARGKKADAEGEHDLGRAETAYNEGTRLLGQNQAARAIRSFMRCTQADKGFALCYRALGIAQAKAKNGPEAVRNYRLYLKVSPGAQDAAEVRQILQQYERAQTKG